MMLRPSNVTREDWQAQSHNMGRPCYCASLVTGHCDFCTGLAAEGGPRWEDARRELEPELIAQRLFEMDCYTR